MCLNSSNVTGIASTMDANNQQQDSKWAVLTPLGAQGSNRVLKNYFKIKNRFGAEYKDSDLSALIGADPAQAVYWHLISQNVDGTTAVNITYFVEMTFFSRFYSLKL